MINTGKCPKCESVVRTAIIEHVEIGEAFHPAWHGISLCCPSCRTVLSVAIDPIAIKADVVEEVVQKLRSGA
jgi:phage FluMu protein Com